MSLPKIVTQEEWTAARRELLEKENDLTRRRDRLNTERRELPMVEVTKRHEFEGPEGTLSVLTNDGDFSDDFGATIDASRGYDEFNYRTLDEYATMGHETMKAAEQPAGRTANARGNQPDFAS
jgi:predicted dithiol-disulfide oxidoreductase (DUF899 family)